MLCPQSQIRSHELIRLCTHKIVNTCSPHKYVVFAHSLFFLFCYFPPNVMSGAPYRHHTARTQVCDLFGECEIVIAEKCEFMSNQFSFSDASSKRDNSDMISPRFRRWWSGLLPLTMELQHFLGLANFYRRFIKN